MALLEGKDRTYVEDMFRDLSHPVRLVVFTQATECQYCRETREIVEELAALSPQVTAEGLDFVGDADAAARLGVDKIPAIAVLGGENGTEDYGIRYFGIPSGYEFSALLEDIIMVGRQDSGLAEETRRQLVAVTEPVHLQVFVTPTCPFCPRAVRLAHQMAFENQYIRADSVEAIEFPHLSSKYNVHGVPRTVINENSHVEGAVPENVLLRRIRETVGVSVA